MIVLTVLIVVGITNPPAMALTPRTHPALSTRADKAAVSRLHDEPVPADYNGDGQADLAVWRPATGTWFIRGTRPVHFGRAGDVPLPADYDGDGRTDLAVWRPGDGMWSIRGQHSFRFGRRGDLPISGKFDTGDAPRESAAVYRRSNCTIYVHGGGRASLTHVSFFPCHSATVSAFPMRVTDESGARTVPDMSPIVVSAVVNGRIMSNGVEMNFPKQTTDYSGYGATGDTVLPMYFERRSEDVFTNITIWRPRNGTWYVRSHFADRNYERIVFGRKGDVPVPADYDGTVDRLGVFVTGLAVWRPANATWYVRGQAPVRFGKPYRVGSSAP